MLYVIAALGLFFLFLSRLLTTGNARYLLAGYNTMSDEKQKLLDLHSYIPYFRRFHVFLGISFLVFGLGLWYVCGEDTAGVFMGIYPIAAYIYFIWRSARFWKGKNNKGTYIGMSVLAITLALVITLMVAGMKEDRLLVNPSGIELQGIYGEKISIDELDKLMLIDTLPKITWRSNGFALGKTNKGYFKTAHSETVKLILNDRTSTFIFIQKRDGKKVYYSSGERPNEAIFREIQSALSAPHLFSGVK